MHDNNIDQTPVTIQIKRLEEGMGLALPAYKSLHAAGMDLPAAVEADNPVVIGPGEIVLVPTGFSIAIPVGYEAQIRPRSGLACKHGITVPNSPGTIDADYRGPVKVGLINLSKKPFKIERGMRIAQMVIKQVERAQWDKVDQLPDTERGQGGFGHTGH